MSQLFPVQDNSTHSTHSTQAPHNCAINHAPLRHYRLFQILRLRLRFAQDDKGGAQDDKVPHLTHHPPPLHTRPPKHHGY